jgi:hypothetical protein
MKNTVVDTTSTVNLQIRVARLPVAMSFVSVKYLEPMRIPVESRDMSVMRRSLKYVKQTRTRKCTQ